MKKVIWKFPFDVKDNFTVGMPAGAQVLCVQTQFDKPNIWAMVNQEKEIHTRHFRIIGTGAPFEEDPCNEETIYIGTFQEQGGALIWHLFEVFKINN